MTLPLPPQLRGDAAAPLAEPVTPGAATTGEVVRGGLWYFSGQIVTLLAALVATPFVIRTLGPERYGVLALMHLLTACLGFSDFGMGIASTRFGAEAYARGDRDEEARVIWTGLLLGALPAAASPWPCSCSRVRSWSEPWSCHLTSTTRRRSRSVWSPPASSRGPSRACSTRPSWRGCASASTAS